MTIQVLVQGDTGFSEDVAAVATLFATREAEFSFNPRLTAPARRCGISQPVLTGFCQRKRPSS